MEFADEMWIGVDGSLADGDIHRGADRPWMPLLFTFHAAIPGVDQVVSVSAAAN